jgi:2',3'-cyclic-nucleotide 2'-phosphodiesterase (5'-nucleotidase family)
VRRARMRFRWAFGWLALVALPIAGATAAPSRTATPITTKGMRSQEVSGGDLVADALLKAGEAQAALVHCGQLKEATIAAGKVTAADVTALLVRPEGSWVVSKISGEGLRTALERSLSQAPDESAYFLQVAGLRVEYDPKAPAGRRITRLTVGGSEVQPRASYRVAMPDDLAKGGSGYFVVPDFNENSIEAGRGGKLDAAASAFLEATPELKYPKPDERGERIVPKTR